MRTLLRWVISAGAIGGALSAVSFAFRGPSSGDDTAPPVAAAREAAPLFSGRDDLRHGQPIGLAAGPAWKPPAEYPAFENLQHVFHRLRSPLVAAELKLTPEQLAALEAADDRFESHLNRLPEILDVKTTTMQAEMDRVRAYGAHLRQENAMHANVLTILQPDQRRRLHEIMCRCYGPDLFEDEAIAKQLGLSDAQRARIEQARLERDKEHWAITVAAGFDTPQVMTPEREREHHECDVKQERITERSLAAILADFSDEQRASYERLIGAPIDVLTVNEQWSRKRF